MAKTLVLGVIYPGVEKYLESYLGSLHNQSDQGFDLLIINDGLKGLEQIAFPAQTKQIDCKLNSAAKTRFLGLQYALENNYDIFISSDTDDYFSENRVAKAKENLNKADFVVNEIDLVSENNEPIRTDILTALKLEQRYNNIDCILDKNLFGLSNTAFRLHRLGSDFYIPDNTIAVDWWLFSYLLLNGSEGVFSPKSKTYYRQYESNTVGLGKQLDEKRLKFGAEVKMRHYENISNYCEENGLNKEPFSSRAEQMKELQEAVENSVFLQQYLAKVNANYEKLFTGWWSEIIPISKMEQL